MGRPVLVVAGMSAREVTAADVLRDLAAPHDATVAFVQLAEPGLAAVLDRLADDGADAVTVVGVSLGTLAPGASWLRRVAAHWWRERREPRPVLRVGRALAADSAELRAAARLARPVTGDEAGLTSPPWEEVPEHRHQVLVCRGPRCTALRSDRTAEALVLELMAAGQGDDDVLVTHTGCQFPCNQAPVLSVQPDDVWYGGVDPDAARTIVREHLVAGRPVATHRLARRRPTDPAPLP